MEVPTNLVWFIRSDTGMVDIKPEQVVSIVCGESPERQICKCKPMGVIAIENALGMGSRLRSPQAHAWVGFWLGDHPPQNRGWARYEPRWGLLAFAGRPCCGEHGASSHVWIARQTRRVWKG